MSNREVVNALEVPGHLDLEARILARDLRTWAERDDSQAQPEARRAVSRVVASIDRTLRELHELRAQIVAEVRQADDAAAARVDALLAERGEARQRVDRGKVEP